MVAPAQLVALGGVAMASIVAALFFLRFWRETHDRLFLFFGLSFGVEAVNRVAIALSPSPNEGDIVFYIVRFLTFALILVAIIDKNQADR